MGGEWQEVVVDEIAASTRNAIVGGPFGSNLVSRDYVDKGVPVIRGQNMGGRWLSGEFAFVSEGKAQSLAANTAKPGDIICTRRGTLGQVSLVPFEKSDCYVVSQSQMKLTVNPDIADFKFFYYVFSSQEQQDYIRQHAIQTGVPHTNLGILRATPVPLPPLLEQRAIAHILGTLDDKIELNRRMNETLEAMARAIFKSWFVAFDPVRAKAEGRDPGLPQHIAELFPDSFEDSELGEIPQGWELRTVNDMATVDKGLSYKGAGLADPGNGLPMVNLGCFGGRGIFNRDSIKWYAGEYKPRHLALPGDLLLANTDMTQKRIVLGSPALLPSSLGSGKYLFTHHTFAVRFKKALEVWSKYLYFSLLQPQFREMAEGYATGTTVLALPKDGLLRYMLPCPPTQLVLLFNSLVDQILNSCERNVEEIETLASLRDTLLPKLISGELRVPEAENVVETAV